MKYSIVIPTYNNCDKFLKPCIQAVLTYSQIKDIELIISANGCTDNTLEYLGNLQDDFNYLNLANHLKIIWHKDALGYAKAVNAGIRASGTEKIVLLNNDAILLPQVRNQWLNLLEQAFTKNSKCGISCSLKKYSPITEMDFAVFFCTMIDKKVFNAIGLLDEQYEVGGNEDIDFCALAQLNGFEVEQPVPLEWSAAANLHVGTFPLWHQGEGTVHNPELVSDWEKTFRRNELRLAKKFNNTDWYEAHKDTV
jgi:GT2 family glycosyltransferase